MNLSAHIVFFRGSYTPDSPLDEIDKAAKLVADVLKQKLKRKFRTTPKIAISVPTPSQWIEDRLFYGGGRLWLDISIQLATPLNEKAYRRQMTGEGDTKDRSLKSMWSFVGIIEEALPVSILASNISAPGILRCFGGNVFVDGHKLVSVSTFSNHLRENIEDARALGWPKEISVSFAKALKWVERTVKRCPTTGSDKASRALAAYSHLAISEGGEALSLFWAMMGLEALYCEGGEGLKKQLFDKAAVIFGPLIENKKTIRGLYDFRSAFVHGSTNIPYSFTSDYESDDISHFHAKVHKSESIAFLLLIASIQWLVKNDQHDLKFSYQLLKTK